MVIRQNSQSTTKNIKMTDQTESPAQPPVTQNTEKIEHAVPTDATHRLADMLSEVNSNEAKVSAARWYAEMIIDRFLSDAAKTRLSPENFAKLSLGEAITEIKSDFDGEIIETLHHIKNFGDRASHYKKGERISSEEAKTVVTKSLQLFDLILVDHLRRVPFTNSPNKATIFSTLLPPVRENVLANLIDFNLLTEDYQRFLLHKYVLACVKNNRARKIKRRLSDLLKKEKITSDLYFFEVSTIQAIERGMASRELPIPNNLADCSRNFAAVLKVISPDELLQNERLIEIIKRLLEEVQPSEIGDYVGQVSYLV